MDGTLGRPNSEAHNAQNAPEESGRQSLPPQSTIQGKEMGDPQDEGGEEQAVLDRARRSHLREPLDQVRRRVVGTHEHAYDEEGNDHEDAAQHARQAAPSPWPPFPKDLLLP